MVASGISKNNTSFSQKFNVAKFNFF